VWVLRQWVAAELTVLQQVRGAGQASRDSGGVQAGDGAVRRCRSFDGHRCSGRCGAAARDHAELVERSAAVVQRFGGTVDKFTGDGIMAVFGAPVALEDHAIRACMAALGVQEQAKQLAVNVQDHDGVELSLRVGLNSGQVIAGRSALALWAIPPWGSRSGWLSGWSRWRRRVG